MEVKTNEGLSSEAVISKLTDASLYTVGKNGHTYCTSPWALMLTVVAINDIVLVS